MQRHAERLEIPTAFRHEPSPLHMRKEFNLLCPETGRMISLRESAQPRSSRLGGSAARPQPNGPKPVRTGAFFWPSLVVAFLTVGRTMRRPTRSATRPARRISSLFLLLAQKAAAGPDGGRAFMRRWPGGRG